MDKVYLTLMLFVYFGLPLIACVLFKTLPIGSIGPLVPISGVIYAFYLPYLLYRSFCPIFKKHEIAFLLVILSVPLGVLLAVIEMNLLIWLSYVFGIMDYQLM